MKNLLIAALTVVFVGWFSSSAFADIKLRQKVSMGEQSFETTRMIKGARERTEQKIETSGEGSEFMPQTATIVQCDLRRTVRLNDRQKLYFVELFPEEVNLPTGQPNTNKSVQTRRGGTVTITYLVTDTGERKTMFGLTARHLKILQEIESSPDSCGGANKSKMETDGWYADFSADFNCPIDVPQGFPQKQTKPDCVDRIINKRSGTGKIGFLLNGTMKMYDENGKILMTQTTETLELSRDSLPAGLFDIPQDYKSVSSAQELYKMSGIGDLINSQNNEEQKQINKTKQTTGAKAVGINLIFGGNAKVNQSEITEYLQNKLRGDNFNPQIFSANGSFDYVLKVEIKQVKESAAGKVGGIFGKITGVETKVGKVEVELLISLFKGDSKTPLAQNRVAQKFDGTAADAVHAAINVALKEVLGKIEN